MTYVIGVSSGIFGAAPQEEKAQYVTLTQKAQYVLTQGVKFNQIDVESMAEFKEPNIEKEIENVKRLGISFGFHGESGAFGGREVPVKLDSAIEDDYVRSHKRIIDTFTQAAKLGGKYYLLHSSETEPFIVLGQHMQPTKLVDFYGRPIKEVMTNEILDWIIKPESSFVWEYMHTTSEELIEHYAGPILRRDLDDYARGKGIKTLLEIPKEEQDRIEKEAKDKAKPIVKEWFKNQFDRREMAFGPERIAYFIIAKYMEMNKENEPLWTDIVKVSVKFNWDNLNDREKEILKDEKNWTINVKEFREKTELWVPAVSAKYIWGHLNPRKDLESKYPDPKKILDGKDNKMYFVIESPMAPAGMENLMRLANPLQFYYLVKHTNFEYFRYAIDFEHVLGNYIDPEKMIDHMPDDGGAYLKVVHMGWPTAIQPAHMPIYVGSEQHQYLYRVLYKLRQKGFKCEESDAYLIYERGSANIQQSVIAIRLIVEHLKNNTDPKKLPVEFFGVGTGELASEERQERAMHEHARDPLKGLLAIPEEEYSFLSAAAVGRPGGGEKWKKEELK